MGTITTKDPDANAVSPDDAFGADVGSNLAGSDKDASGATPVAAAPAPVPVQPAAPALPTADEAFGAEPPPAAPPEQPKPSPGFIERMYNTYQGLRSAIDEANKAGSKGIREGMGSEPFGESEMNALREAGIVSDPSKGRVGPIRMLNDVIAGPASIAVDAIVRHINAGIYGVGSAAGSLVKSATGDETQGEQAKREFINFSNYLQVTAGGVNPLYTTEHVLGGGVREVPIAGGLPALHDFDKTAEAFKHADAAAPLKQLYDERGVHPAEVWHAAQTDPTIAQDLAAGKVPDSFGGAKPGGFSLAPQDVEYHPSQVEYLERDGRTAIIRSIRGPDGKVVGHFEGSYNPATKGIEISDIAYHGETGESANSIGPAGIRALRDQLHEEFPDAKAISGHRESGARSEAAKQDRSASVNLNTGETDADATARLEAEAAARKDAEGKLVAVHSDNAAADRGERAAGSPAQSFTAIEKGSRDTTPAVQEGGAGGDGGEPPKGGNALPGREEPLALTGPKKTPTLEEASDALGERISVGNHDKKSTSFQDIYTTFVDDLNPVHEAVKNALSETAASALPEGVKKGEPLPTHLDPYALFRLTRGVAGKADEMVNRGTFSALSYKTNGIGLKQVLAPLADLKPIVKDKAAIDEFRRYVSAKRAIELEARGVESGMPMDAAHVYASDPAMVKQYEPIHKAAVAYQNRLSLYLRDAGLITQKGYDAMIAANQNYTPFFRYMSDATPVERRFGTGKKLSSRNPIKAIEGADAGIIDPIESMVKNTYSYIALAEKNMAGKELVDALKRADLGVTEHRELTPAERATPRKTPKLTQIEGPKPPALDAPKAVDGEVLPPPEPKGVIEKRWSEMNLGEPKPEPALIEGAKQTVFDAEYTEVKEALAKDGVEDPDLLATITTASRKPEGEKITIFRGGVRETYRVSDKALFDAWRGLDAQTTSTLTRLLSTPARLLRVGATLDPAFSIGNLIRDFQGAFVNTKGALFSPISTAKGMAALITKGESYRNWLKGGGANAALVSLDRRYLQENMTHLGEKTGLGTKVWNTITSPIEGLRMVSEFAENSTRLGEFTKAMKAAENAKIAESGGTLTRSGAQAAATKGDIQDAAMRSREITVDFSRKGSQMQAYNMITAFANANIQGTDRLIRAFHDAPVSTSMRIAAGITAPSLLLWGYNNSTPEKRARYDDIPRWERDMFYTFMTDHWRDATPADQAMPSYLKRTVDGKMQVNDGTTYRIKKDFVTGMIFGTGAERIAEYLRDNDPKAFEGLLTSIAQALEPGVVPTFMTPPVEQFANKNLFTGAKIVPDRLANELPEYQYEHGTTELAKTLGKAVGAFPGIRDAEGSGVFPANGIASALNTPALVEQYVRDWTGSLGNYMLQLTDAALRKAGALQNPIEPTPTLADIPFIKSFVVRYPSAQAQQIQDFYDRNNGNAAVVNTIKARAALGDKDAIDRVRAIDGDLVKLDGIQKSMAAQEKLIRNIYSIGEMDGQKLAKNPEYKPTLTPQQMRQNIDTLYWQMLTAAKAGNKMLDVIDAKH